MYSKEEAIAVKELYKETFDFGTGPLRIENPEENEDFLRLESVVQKPEKQASRAYTENIHKNTYEITSKNRYSINRSKKYTLLRKFRRGEIDLEGVGYEDYRKYWFKYNNKKAKKNSKVSKYLKHQSNVRRRQEEQTIRNAYVEV